MSTTHDDGMDPTEGILADLASLRASRDAADSTQDADPNRLAALDDIADAAGRLRESEPDGTYSADTDSNDAESDDAESDDAGDTFHVPAAHASEAVHRSLFFAPFSKDAAADSHTAAAESAVDDNTYYDELDDDSSGSDNAASGPVVDPRNPFSHSSDPAAGAYAPVVVPTGGGLLFQPPQEELAQTVETDWYSDDDADTGRNSRDNHDDRDDRYGRHDGYDSTAASDADDQTDNGGDDSDDGGDSGDDSDDGRSRSRRRRGGRGRRSRSRDRSSDTGSDDDDQTEGSNNNKDHAADHGDAKRADAERTNEGTASTGDDDQSESANDDDGSSNGRRGNRRGRRRRTPGGDETRTDSDSTGDSDSGNKGDRDTENTTDRDSSSRTDRDSTASSDDSQSAGRNVSGNKSGNDSGNDQDDSDDDSPSSRRRRRRRGRTPRQDGGNTTQDSTSTGDDQVTAIKGSTRLEAKRQRRREGREAGRRRPLLTEAEFLARRESVSRTMLVREQEGRTQLVVLEDGIAVEHYLSEHTAQASLIGNVYLGRVQNVLPSMEAAFLDIGKGRNAVLYAGEVNWDALGMNGKPHRIETALSAGDPVLVQVTKDPVGHKGARLTSQISLPGRFLVYIPGNSMTGISRKLPDNERARLKKLLKEILPEKAGVIVRTASEGATDDELSRDVDRLAKRWESIEKKSTAPKATAPRLLYSEPDMIVRIIRDVFNEDFESLVVDGDGAWDTIHEYVEAVAPDLLERVSRYGATGTSTADDAATGTDIFDHFRVNEQVEKALSRKVNLPSGGSLVIDRTEAMTVVDVNTGKFVGSGGNLEETVTKNNLEAAEEVIRQLRMRDIGGIIVVDFIDMVLESNRDLVTRRLVECLARDRTRHQVAEVTSLGLVQMTRKRIGTGLAESLSAAGEDMSGRGLMLPGTEDNDSSSSQRDSQRGRRRGRNNDGDSGDTATEKAPQQKEPVAEEKQTQSRSAVAAIAKATLKNAEADSSGTDETADSQGSTTTGRTEAADSSSGASDGRRSRRRGGRTRSASQDESAQDSSPQAADSSKEPSARGGSRSQTKDSQVEPSKPEPSKPEAWQAFVPAESTGPAPFMIGADTTTTVQTKAAEPKAAKSASVSAGKATGKAATESTKEASTTAGSAKGPLKTPVAPTGPILMLGMDD